MAKTREELLLEQVRKKYGVQQPKQVEEPKNDITSEDEGGLLASIKDYFGGKAEERKAWKENLEEQDLGWLAKSQGKNMQMGQQLAQTFYNTLENVVDTGADILAKGADAVGWDGISKGLTDFSNINLTEEITSSDAFKLAQQTGLIKLGGSSLSNPTGIIPGIAKNYAGSLIAGDQDKVFEMAHNKEMLPPIATDVTDSLSSMVVMGTLGQGSIPAIMGISGAGAFQESYDEGGSFGESLAYGATSGIIEGLAEKFVGAGLEKIGLGNNKVGGLFGGSKSGSVVEDFIKSFNEEGMEELVSQSISPFLKKLTFKSEEDIATIFEEDGGVEALFEAYMLGGLSGGIGGASSSISNISKYGVEGKNAFKNLEDAKESFEKLVKLDKSGNLNDDRIAKHEKKIKEHLNEYLKNMELLKQKYGKNSSQYKNTLSETGRMAIDLDTMTANDVNIANEINESKAKIKSYHSYIPQEYQAEIKKILGDKATETDLNSNAYITSDGRILVNRGSNAYKQGRLYNVVGHEIIHTIENTPEYAKMLNDYNESLTSEEKQATINKYRASYGQQMTDEQIMNEMFADYVGKNVATNYKEFKKMLGNKQSFWSKLIDAVKGYKGIVHEGARKLQSDVANAINKSTGNMQTAKASKDIEGGTNNAKQQSSGSANESDDGSVTEGRNGRGKETDGQDKFGRNSVYRKWWNLDSSSIGFLRRIHEDFGVDNVNHKEFFNKENLNKFARILLEHNGYKNTQTTKIKGIKAVLKEYYTPVMKDIAEENRKLGVETEFFVGVPIKDGEPMSQTNGFYNEKQNKIYLKLANENLVKVNRHEKLHFWDILNRKNNNNKAYQKFKREIWEHYNSITEEERKNITSFIEERYHYGEKYLNGKISMEEMHLRSRAELEACVYSKQLELQDIKFQNKLIDDLTKSMAKINDIENIRFSKDVEVDSQGNTLSEEQVEHFKDVHEEFRDEYGNLKVLYHGTQQGGFTIFNTKAIYLTDSLDVSKTYSKSDNTGYKDKKTNYKVYANVKNPFVIDCNGGHWSKIETDINDFIDEQFTDAITSQNQKQIMAFIELNLKYGLKVNYTKENSNKIKFENGYIELDNNKIYTNKGSYPNYKEFCKDYFGKKFYTSTDTILGKILFDPKYSNYDGIVFKNVVDTGGTYKGDGDTAQSNVYVAFNVNQIKDIENRKPTSNPDIRFSKDVDEVNNKEYNLDEYKTADDFKHLSEEILEKMNNLALGNENQKSLNTLYNEAKKSNNKDDFDNFKNSVETFEYYYKTSREVAKKGKSLDPKFISNRLSKAWKERIYDKPDGVNTQYGKTIKFNKERVAELEKLVVEQDETAIKLEQAKQVLFKQRDRIEKDFGSIVDNMYKDGKSYSLYLTDRINNLKDEAEFHTVMSEITEYKKALQEETDKRSGLAKLKERKAELQTKLDGLRKYEETRLIDGKTEEARAKRRAKIEEVLDKAQILIDNVTDEDTYVEAFEMLNPAYDKEGRKSNVYKMIESNTKLLSEMTEGDIARASNNVKDIKSKYKDKFKELSKMKSKAFNDTKYATTSDNATVEKMIQARDALKQTLKDMEAYFNENFEVDAYGDKTSIEKFENDKNEIIKRRTELKIKIEQKQMAEELNSLKKEEKAQNETRNLPSVEDTKEVAELIKEIQPKLVENKPTEVEKVATQVEKTPTKVEKTAKTAKLKVEKTAKQEVKTKVISNSKQVIKRDLAKNIKGEADQTQLVKYTQKSAENMINTIKILLRGNKKYKSRLIFNGEGVKTKIADVFEVMNSEGTIDEKTNKIYDMIKDGIEIKAKHFYPSLTKGEYVETTRELYTSITYELNPYIGTSVETFIENKVKTQIKNSLNTEAKPTTLARKLEELSIDLQNQVNEICAKMEEYELENRRLTQEIIDIKNNIGTAKNEGEVQKYQEDIKKLEKKIDNLEAKFSNIIKKEQKYKAKIEALKVDNATLSVSYKDAIKKLRKTASKQAKAEANVQQYEFKETTQREINKLVNEVSELKGWKINADPDFMTKFASIYSKGMMVEATDLLLNKVLETKVKDDDGNEVKYQEYMLLDEEDIDFIKGEILQNLAEIALNGKPTQLQRWKEKIAELKAKTTEKRRIEKKINALKRELGYDIKVIEKKGGGVDPDYVSANIKLTTTLKHLTASEIRKGAVRDVLSEFLNDYNSKADELPILMDDDLKYLITQIAVAKGEVTSEEVKVYKDVMNGLKKYFKDIRHERNTKINGVDYKLSDLTHQGIEESQKIAEKVSGEELIMNLSDAQDPRVIFERIDAYQNGVWTKLYDMLVEGDIEFQKAYIDLYNPFQEFYAKHKKFRKDLKKKVTIKGFTSTINKMLYAYETLTDADSMQHALGKGLVFEGKVLKFKDEAEVNEFKKEIEDQFKLNEENEYSEYVKLIDNWGIENAKIKKAVDFKVKGFTNIKSDKYFGFEVDDSHFAQEIGGDPLRSNESLALKEQRFNKNRTKNGAPLKIQDINTTIQIRTNAMAMYHGFGERLDTFNYVLNAKYENGISLMNVARERFGRSKGERGYKLDNYLNKLANDLQGRIDSKEIKFLRKLRSAYSTYVLGLNLQTGAKQFGAIINATKHIKIQNILRPGKIDNIPLPTSAQYRQFRDSYITAEGQVEHQKGTLSSDVMIFTRKADELTVRMIWRGALYQTRNADGSFNVVEAEKLFEKTMRETQATGSALERSGLLRNQNDLIRSFTMFSSEPAKQFSNITESLERIYYNAKINGKVQGKDIKNFMGATSRALASATFSVLVTQLFRWWREKDDEEDKLEYMLQKLANEMLDIIPVFGNITNIDTSRPIPISFDTDLNVIGDLLSTLNDFTSSPSLDNAFKLVCQIRGIPYENIKTSIFTTMKKNAGAVDKGFGTHMKEWVYQQEARNKSFANKEPINSALKVGRDTKAKAYYDKYTDNIMITSRDVKDELFRLYSSGYSKETGVTTSGAFLKPIPTTIAYNNEVINLDYDTFNLYYSEVNKQMEKLIHSSAYNKLSDEQKDKSISMLVNAYYNIAKKAHTGEELNNTEILLFSGYNNFSTIAPHLAYIKSISSDDKNSRKKLVQQYINTQFGITKGQKYLIYYLAGYSLNDDNKELVIQHLKSKGLSTREIKALFPEKLENGDDW